MGAPIVLFTALFVAPLVLGTFVVAQRANRQAQVAWFGFLTAIFVLVFILGGLALLATPL